MNQALNDYLNAPIPRKVALAVVTGQAIGMTITSAIGMRRIAKQANEIIADAEQRVSILKESTHFLLDRADDKTASELNAHLDYWRVVRGIPAELGDFE